MSNRFHILPQEFFELPLWGRTRRYAEAEAYLDLRLHCCFHDSIVTVGRKKLVLLPGQQIASIQGLAERWRWNRRTVRNFLNELALQGVLQVIYSGPVMILTLSIRQSLFVVSPEDAAENGPPLPPDPSDVEETDCPAEGNHSKNILRTQSQKEILESFLESPPDLPPEPPVSNSPGGDSQTDSKTDFDLMKTHSKTKPEAAPKAVTSEDLLPPWVPDPASTFPPDYPQKEFVDYLRTRLVGKGHARYRGNMLAAIRAEFEQQWRADHPAEAARLGLPAMAVEPAAPAPPQAKPATHRTRAA